MDTETRNVLGVSTCSIWRTQHHRSCRKLGPKAKGILSYLLSYSTSNGFIHDVMVTFSLQQTNFRNNPQEQNIPMSINLITTINTFCTRGINYNT